VTEGRGSPLPPPGGPYSLVRRGPGGLVFIAGQVAVDPATRDLVEGGIREQTRQAIENVKTVLATADCTLSDVLKVSVFLASRSDFAEMNEVYRSMFPEPFPVRTTVQVGLGAGELIEIDVVAAAAGSPRPPDQPLPDPAAG
jgi:2-iminobutanoate/2-iminopropanoate deaminase